MAGSAWKTLFGGGENEGESRPGFQKGSAGARLAQIFSRAKFESRNSAPPPPTYWDHSRIADSTVDTYKAKT